MSAAWPCICAKSTGRSPDDNLACLSDRWIASKRPDMQKRDSAYPSLRVDIRAFFQKQSDHIPPSLLNRDEKRRDAVLS
jgi:hypothetical protein